MTSKSLRQFDLENFAPYIISTLSRQFATLLEQSLKKKGLSISNWRVLLCLSEYKTRTLNEIVDYTLLPQSTLSRSLNRMQDRNLIIRQKRKDDHRTYDIEITNFGLSTLSTTYKEIQAICDEPLAVLTSEEKQFWLSTTKKIIDNFGYS